MQSDAPVSHWRVPGSLVTGLLYIACQAAAADAQVVSICDAALEMDKIAYPEDMNIRHYANGHVLVAVVDDGRPDAARALSFLVVSPPLDAQGERQCRLVSATQMAGYAALVLDRAEATYSPAIGLTVSVPAVVVPTAESLGDKIDLAVTINQATGMITPYQSETHE